MRTRGPATTFSRRSSWAARGGVLFRAAARDGEACAGLKAHFHALFEARRQPWPTCARGARGGPEQRHPEEALALEAEALALEAEREVASSATASAAGSSST